MLTAARQLCAQLLHLMTQKQAAFLTLPTGIPWKMCFTQFIKGHKTICVQSWEGISQCPESARWGSPWQPFHRAGSPSRDSLLELLNPSGPLGVGDSTSCHWRVAQHAEEEVRFQGIPVRDLSAPQPRLRQHSSGTSPGCYSHSVWKERR